MAHPNKKEATDTINAKMRAMTRHYGEAAPSMNVKAPVNRLKTNGPEDHVGFGAEYDAPSARADKPGRKSVAANPVATYKKGGAACGPVEVATRARGGRMKHKGHGTHVNVIVAPQGNANPTAGGPPPQLANLAAGGPRPPMPAPAPAAPPMGGPPMGAGAPMPGGPMMRKRGGKVTEQGDTESTYHAEGLIKFARGERLGRAKHILTGGLTGGGDSGIGRLEKIGQWEKHGDKSKQEV